MRLLVSRAEVCRIYFFGLWMGDWGVGLVYAKIRAKIIGECLCGYLSTLH